MYNYSIMTQGMHISTHEDQWMTGN